MKEGVVVKDTSYAILPSKANKTEVRRHEILSVESYVWDGKILEGSLSKGTFRFYFINDKIMRFIVNPFGEIDGSVSIAAIGDCSHKEGILHETNENINLTIGSNQLEISKKPFGFTVKRGEKVVFQTSNPCVAYNANKNVYMYVKKDSDSPVYGLGEKSGFLDKNGSKISNWNTDVFAAHNKDTVELYQSIPFSIIHKLENTIGIFFDNSYRTEFDMQTYHEQLTMMAEGGQINTYILIGEDVKDTIKLYTDLTGTTPLPPKWSLGYHQSRYSYSTQSEVKQIVECFKKYKIPLDCIFLDIHYMNDFRVFTVDEDKFPQFKEMIEELKNKNIDVVPIVDPGVKKDIQYSVYLEGMSNNYFCKYIDGTVYYGDVWPGKSAFPDFFNPVVQKWWGNLHEFYTKLGVRGIWNDMNEPSVFNETKTMDLDVIHNENGNIITHKEGHNLYGLYMSKATFEGMQKLLQNKRPFSLTRAGYSGVQRYSAVWTGDNRSHWEHLEMSLPMIMNLGMSGVAFSGADVGGFSSDTTPELLIRWTQVGAFLPYFRNHSVQDSIYQEPWVFGQETMEVVRKYIELRYRFLPYIYTLFYEAEKTGLPIVRPLIMEYPKDKNTFQCSDQFLLGPNVLIAPILRPGQTHRSVYLPQGKWYDFWNNQLYEGGKYYLISADLETLPIFIKSGTVLPLGTPVQNTKESQDIELKVYYSESEDAIGYLYEDDGLSYDYRSNKYSLRTFMLDRESELNTHKEGLFQDISTIKSVEVIGKLN